MATVYPDYNGAYGYAYEGGSDVPIPIYSEAELADTIAVVQGGTPGSVYGTDGTLLAGTPLPGGDPVPAKRDPIEWMGSAAGESRTMHNAGAALRGIGSGPAGAIQTTPSINVVPVNQTSREAFLNQTVPPGYAAAYPQSGRLPPASDDGTTGGGYDNNSYDDYYNDYSGGGYDDGGRYTPADAMRGAGLNARGMGYALRDYIGAPQPYMPGQDSYDSPTYLPDLPPAPYHPSTPPWPGASATGLYGGGGSSGGGYPGSVGDRLASARSRIQNAMGGRGGGGGAPAAAGGMPVAPGSTPAAGGGGGVGRIPMDRLGGFARRQDYNPATLNEMIWYHPDYVLPDVFPGLKTTDPAYQTLANLPFNPQTLMMLGPGATKKGMDNLAAGDYANFLDKFYRQVTTGGRWPDTGELMENMLDPRKGSALAMQMQAMTPEQQIYTLGNYMTDIAGTTNPMLAPALSGYFGTQLAGYGNAMLDRRPQAVVPATRYLRRAF